MGAVDDGLQSRDVLLRRAADHDRSRRAGEVLVQLVETQDHASTGDHLEYEVGRGDVAGDRGAEIRGLDLVEAGELEIQRASPLIRSLLESDLLQVGVDRDRGDPAVEVTDAVGDLGPAQAGNTQLMGVVRRSWAITSAPEPVRPLPARRDDGAPMHSVSWACHVSRASTCLEDGCEPIEPGVSKVAV